MWKSNVLSAVAVLQPSKDLFLLMCVYATYLQVPKEARGGIRSFGAGVSEECELTAPALSAGN